MVSSIWFKFYVLMKQNGLLAIRATCSLTHRILTSEETEAPSQELNIMADAKDGNSVSDHSLGEYSGVVHDA